MPICGYICNRGSTGLEIFSRIFSIKNLKLLIPVHPFQSIESAVMNRTALFGIAIAFILPLTAYFIMKNKSREVTSMPRYYIGDSVMQTTRDGKDYSDTVWHTIPDFKLVNQLGQQVGWKDLKDKIVVAKFFFTHCPTICPPMTLNMKLLRDGIKSSAKVGSREAKFVHFLSFSIDPERDSVPRLKNWADRFQINPQNWWLLTGDRKQIYDLAIKDMGLLTVDGENVDSNFVHTDFFVLIDKERHIRGYYHSLKDDGSPDTAALSKLSRDVIYLSLEKDPQKKSMFAGKLELLAVVFGAAMLGLVLLFTYLRREKKPA